MAGQRGSQQDENVQGQCSQTGAAAATATFLSPAGGQDFHVVLSNLISEDNDIRNAAEASYEALDDSIKLSCLLPSIQNNNLESPIRELAAVLLRRLFSASYEDSYQALSPENQTVVRQQLLVGVQQETDTNLCRKICDIVSELARSAIDDDGNNSWPEVLTFLFDCANSTDLRLKEMALHIFSSVPTIFGNQQTQYLEVIKQMLLQYLTDQASQKVRLAAAKALANFLLQHEEDLPVQRHFVDCLPSFMQILAYTIQEEDDDSVLKALIDLAETCPKYLRSQLEPILDICIKTIGNEESEDSWRQLTIEVIVSLSETAPGMLRKHVKFIHTLVPLLLKLMSDVDEESDWAFQDEAEEPDNESNSVTAESALDRLACGLGGKTILPQVIQNIPSMLQNADWKYRHAALMAISAVGEGCHKQMEALLEQIVGGIIPFLQDAHPRVRYAACNALGQMSTDFAPVFQKKFHEKVMSGLLMALEDQAHPRVQAHAGAALVNFCEDCPKTILSQYLVTIMTKLEIVLNSKIKELMEKGTKLVLEQVVTTIAAVADTAEEKFATHYDRVMPSLKLIIENAVSEELRLLRGKTIECVSLIGLAVGKEKFMGDASDVMQLLLKTQTEQANLADDDPQISYMISAWARMCKILGKEFEQYLPIVMGPVLKAASIKPEVAVIDEEDAEDMQNDDDWQFINLGDQQSFGIRTAGLEEKATACQMIVCYAKELKEGFAPYVEEAVKVMVPMLKFYFHDGVRTAAAESLHHLLECGRIQGDDYVVQMWSYMWPELIKSVEAEPDMGVLAEQLSAIAKTTETLGAGCLNAEQVKELVKMLETQLLAYFKRQLERQEKRKDEDYDEQVEEDLADESEEDMYILAKISDVLHSMFGILGPEFFPYFDQLLPHYITLIGQDHSWNDHQWALCVFDDLLEFGREASINYSQYFVGPMLRYISDPHPEVRQAASYGVGVMAQFGGQQYALTCKEALPSLVKVISESESRSPENAGATENCISAVAKICQYNSSAVDVDEILPHWFSWLPVWEDAEEAPHIYRYFCTLVESNNSIILGQANQNVPQIVKIIAECFVTEILDDDSDEAKRMLNIARQIQGNQEMFTACLQNLSAEQQHALSQHLSSSAAP